jgi:transposase-like protein
MPTLPPLHPAIPRCPRCRAEDAIKKGTRRTRHEARQHWGCHACSRSVITQITQYSCYPVTLIPEAIWHLAAAVPSLRPQDLLDDAD